MPTFKNQKTIRLPGKLELSVNLEMGIVRRAPGSGGAANGRRGTLAASGSLKQAARRLASRGLELAKSGTSPSSAANSDEAQLQKGLDPSKMVWIFGSGRSGSTWLRSMMSELPDHRVWEEPMVGLLFGRFYSRAQTGQLASANFIMSNPTRRGWMRSVRNFVLDGARYAHPRLRPENYLVVKEPNGSVGAPLIMEALPESRMVLLIRDPRDVVASVLDATRDGGWLYQQKSSGAWKENAVADRDPDKFVRMRAKTYQRDAGGAAEAYHKHKGPKTLVRYEDLVADTAATMRRVYEELGIQVGSEELEAAVDKHSWENIPEEKKGEGKFYRRGSSGGWKEDLTQEQVEIVEEITAPLLEEFYPSSAVTLTSEEATRG